MLEEKGEVREVEERPSTKEAFERNKQSRVREGHGSSRPGHSFELSSELRCDGGSGQQREGLWD